jgi:hypothetical protein
MSKMIQFDICIKPVSIELLSILDGMVSSYVAELEKRSAVWAEPPSISVRVQDYLVSFFIYGINCGEYKRPGPA